MNRIFNYGCRAKIHFARNFANQERAVISDPADPSLQFLINAIIVKHRLLIKN